MEKPQPVPGQVPEFQPPPYSSLLGSQCQSYTPVPPVPTAPSYPMQMPMPQDTTIYNPMSQVTMDDRRPISQPGFNPTYTPTTYDPMANLPSVNQASMPNQTIIIASHSDVNTSRRTKRCRYLKICAPIGVILVALYIGLRVSNRATNLAKAKEEELRRAHSWYGNDNNGLARQNDHDWSQYNNRYRRMAGVDEIKDFKDYVHVDFNDQILFNKLINPEKSVRQRRNFNTKNKFGERKVKLSSKKKKYYKAKKFIR